ncbi:hypothetical protein A3I36_00215 [Candidatus Giovannonibacteria bacterium RIFCSPLOWO2_02_FULL_45_28]|uniref:Uncharacterized protein n=2 Tax=Candidatus Giovannoniibacteriota TaxID=1752738 RepID=A0A1F5WAT5_9BACT|nr:MAG: hypothetical protein UW15_C0019G0014 [Parcubacteria group bacterium GW2011_GWC1_44_10]KKT59267.1 MAG: hypothetical protein UW53_C0017G0014 [Candidatus Giovannonibacteria bacterium GW2011_GWA1_44_25]KKU29553.1 MAG: hypothetical protein UX43_C0009G0005 [Candidatus Giovannonibacteria bacterium GW2011_GWB1_46_20]OGF49231.1 MAG: hypothetical protein A2120_04115 [Candidatus Giovannonibacteria bacterium GWA2_45_15]OGF59531.1 MAG: hypothetical protein A2W40_02800 [Candidatus Giovannonibacteria 
MRIKICKICAAVSGTWLILTALILARYLNAETFMPLVLLLMGGTVVGIADRAKTQKPLIIGVGIILAFWAVRNLSFWVFILELAALFALAYFFFAKPQQKISADNPKPNELEEKLKDCC